MARRKAQLTQEELIDLAEKAQDMALDISAAADTISVMSKFDQIAASAAKFNQLIEAASLMNRMLLAVAAAADDRAALERKFKESA
jgi:hypothetical protein